MLAIVPDDPPVVVHILLVEDDPGDVAYARDVLDDHKVRNRLTAVADGRGAIACLRREGRFAGLPPVDLILLDLNLPGVDGRGVLNLVKADPALARIPLVLLTNSALDQQMLSHLRLPTDMYMQKPLDFDRLVQLVRRVDDFYFSVERLPIPL
jgi:CheY-like chemotaxis protein